MKSRLPQLFRLALLAAALLLIHRGFPPAPPAEPPPWSEITRWFPDAASLGPATETRQAWPVKNDQGQVLGQVLRTAPQTDALIGYAGPNDLLLAEKPDGTLLGVSILHSADTPDHVRLVRDDPAFLPSFTNWNPATQPPPSIDAVSGATLTSLTMAESVIQRLGKITPSLKFPTPPSLQEILPLFPSAATFDGRTVRDSSQKILGHILRTSPSSDNLPGYSGPTECLIALEPDAATVRGITIRKSYDTPDYVEQIQDDFLYLRSFKGRTLTQLAALDFTTEKVQGVSGATLTSYAIAEGLKQRAALATEPPAQTSDHQPFSNWKWRDTLLVLTISGGLLLAFTSLRGNRAVRMIWQALLIFYIGLTTAQLLSLGLLTGWARHGAAWKNAPSLVLLAVAALLVPWATGRQIYCHHLCPHGAAQTWLGRLRRKKTTVPPALGRWLERLPAALLAVSFFAAIGAISINNADLEPFDAWAWRAAGPASLLLAAAGLFLSIFIPQAYCRYGCPTGALLKWIRYSGSANRLSSRDALALVCLITALLWSAQKQNFSPSAPTASPHKNASAIPPPKTKTPASHEPDSNPQPPQLTLSGKTMGTTWTVKIRQPTLPASALQHGIQSRLDAVENLLSTWRADTPLSRFNTTRHTRPIPVPEEILTLVNHGQSLSRTTNGAYDLTAGPLVKAWSFGPPPRSDQPPSPSRILTLLESTGHEKILLPPTLDSLTGLTTSPQPDTGVFPLPPAPPTFLFPGLTKTDPKLELDLNSLAEGFALDRIHRWLKATSCQDFLIEIGGELFAAGSWTVALDFPWRTLVLTNSALATSGSYRQSRNTSAGPGTHLIDPRTGQPIRHATRCVSVLAPDGLTADSWATALTIPPPSEAFALACRLGLAARFVTAPTTGELRVNSTPAWPHAAVP